MNERVSVVYANIFALSRKVFDLLVCGVSCIVWYAPSSHIERSRVCNLDHTHFHYAEFHLPVLPSSGPPGYSHHWGTRVRLGTPHFG
jgi:hypothetical protein